MRILVAFDKFKDALTAPEACAVARDALGGSVVECCPLSDGGDGFAQVMTAALGGHLAATAVTGPRGESATADLGWVDLTRLPPDRRARLVLEAQLPGPTERVAVIDAASACGLAQVPRPARDPWHTTSAGVGDLILTAWRGGATAALLGLGGVATHDLGLGALERLGVCPFDARGRPLPRTTPDGWGELATFDGRPDLPLTVRLATDVANPLTGLRGAAYTYARQKGLPEEDRERLDELTRRTALRLAAHFGRRPDLLDQPGTGAAGGLAFGLAAACGARVVPGFDLVSTALGLEEKIRAADLIITGEGRFDETSLQGKGPGELVRQAARAGKAVLVFAGSFAPITPALLPAGVRLHAITTVGTPLSDALRLAPTNLRATIRKVLG